MQTLSLEDEFKRIDGVPYIIDFYQNYTESDLEGSDNRMGISEIIDEIMNPKMIHVRQQNDKLCLENRQHSEEFWRLVNKTEKKAAKREKKWEKHHQKVSGRQAFKNFNRIYNDMIGG